MNVCGRSECQSTAGCAHRGPNMELCWFSFEKTPIKPPLSVFTDDEIATEYYRRALRKLGYHAR